jgi:hypothetical protein
MAASTTGVAALLYISLFFPAFYYGLLVLAIGFAILFLFQFIHFATMYKGDIFRNKTLNKCLTSFGLFLTLLELFPIAMMALGASSTYVAGLFYILSFVGSVTYFMAWFKLLPILDDMIDNGKISRYNRTLFGVSAVLIVIGSDILVFVTAILGFNYIVSLIGLMLFLHPLNMMRKSVDSKVLKRIFGAAVSQTVLGLMIIITLIIIISIVSNSKDLLTVFGSVIFGVLFILLLVLGVLSASLFMAGYWIGDLCCRPEDFLGDLESQTKKPRGTELARPSAHKTTGTASA